MTPRGQSWQDIWLTYFKRPHNHLYEGRTVAEVALMREQHPVDALCDYLIADRGATRVLVAAISEADISSIVWLCRHGTARITHPAVA